MNQIKASWKTSPADLPKPKEYYWKEKARLMKYGIQISIRKKINKPDHNIHKLWDIIKRSNLRTHRLEEGDEIIYTKDIENLFNKTIAECFLNLERDGYPDTRSIKNPCTHD